MTEDAKTLGDLAATGELEGRRVRFLGRDVSLVPFGTLGQVERVSQGERPPRVLVRYVIESRPRRSAFREVCLESRLRYLELAP